MVDGVWTEVIKQVKECYSSDNDPYEPQGNCVLDGTC